MRIYNKKTFGFGIFALALGLLNIVAGVMTGFDGKGVFLIVLLFLIGAGSLARSLSQKMSREDKLEERDERNQLIDMKSKSLAFRLTQGISFVLGLLFLVSGAVARYMSRSSAWAAISSAVPFWEKAREKLTADQARARTPAARNRA